MTLGVVLLVVGILFGVVGLIVAWMGWRGRRVGDEVRCRMCGYELTGLAEPLGRCPECGADVSVVGGRSVGHRRRRMGWVVVGLVLIAIGGVGGIVQGPAQRVSLWPWVPEWCLVWSPGGLSDDGWNEVDRRAGKDKLSAGGFRRLADYFAGKQADESQPWDRSDCYRMAYLTKKTPLSEEQIKTYARHGVSIVRLQPFATMRSLETIEIPVQGEARFCESARNALEYFIQVVSPAEAVSTPVKPHFQTMYAIQQQTAITLGNAHPTPLAVEEIKAGRPVRILVWEGVVNLYVNGKYHALWGDELGRDEKRPVIDMMFTFKYRPEQKVLLPELIPIPAQRMAIIRDSIWLAPPSTAPFAAKQTDISSSADGTAQWQPLFGFGVDSRPVSDALDGWTNLDGDVLVYDRDGLIWRNTETILGPGPTTMETCRVNHRPVHPPYRVVFYPVARERRWNLEKHPVADVRIEWNDLPNLPIRARVVPTFVRRNSELPPLAEEEELLKKEREAEAARVK